MLTESFTARDPERKFDALIGDIGLRGAAITGKS
jgi:hypothetical protein